MADDVVELRQPDSKFPVDITRKPKQLDAYQFSNYDHPNVTFGMDSKKTADALRAIADRIESGEYMAQSGGVFTYARIDEYVMTCVNIKFHARKVAES